MQFGLVDTETVVHTLTIPLHFGLVGTETVVQVLVLIDTETLVQVVGFG